MAQEQKQRARSTISRQHCTSGALASKRDKSHGSEDLYSLVLSFPIIGEGTLDKTKMSAAPFHALNICFGNGCNHRCIRKRKLARTCQAAPTVSCLSTTRLACRQGAEQRRVARASATAAKWLSLNDGSASSLHHSMHPDRRMPHSCAVS